MLFTLPMILTLAVTLLFLAAERIWPGRELPNAPGWYARALLFNGFQLAITVATNNLWIKLAGGISLLNLSALKMPVLEGFIGWFVGSFFFYWWHRLRHASGFWQVFHQIHHSPARIEALTSFYKHPVEIFSDALLAAVVLYLFCGVSIEGAIWFNFFAATGEYFYHANLRTPSWARYIIQTPELHSIHHERDVHRFNFSDLPIWDRLFGTYRDATDFAPACGFPNHNERKIGDMLCFRDVYDAPLEADGNDASSTKTAADKR